MSWSSPSEANIALTARITSPWCWRLSVTGSPLVNLLFGVQADQFLDGSEQVVQVEVFIGIAVIRYRFRLVVRQGIDFLLQCAG